MPSATAKKPSPLMAMSSALPLAAMEPWPQTVEIVLVAAPVPSLDIPPMPNTSWVSMSEKLAREPL